MKESLCWFPSWYKLLISLPWTGDSGSRAGTPPGSYSEESWLMGPIRDLLNAASDGACGWHFENFWYRGHFQVHFTWIIRQKLQKENFGVFVDIPHLGTVFEDV